jgi:hypothetical protein
MRRLTLLVAGIAVAVPLGVPAHADVASDSWVTTGYATTVVPLDSGYEVIVLCDASSGSSDQAAVPVATSIWCSVNGQSMSRAMPGRESYVTVNATVVGPYTVCTQGQAAFVQPVKNEIGVPTTGPTCRTEQI